MLRGFDDQSVDLIYLDPPFCSNRTYSAPIGSEAAGAAFKDSWSMDDVKAEEIELLKETNPKIYKICSMAGDVHSKSMMAYLLMMSMRLTELHRVLKDTGSIYLHVDPTAATTSKWLWTPCSAK